MENFKVSMRYAKALFPIAKTEGKSEKVLDDLTNIVNLINTSSDLRLLIYSPVITLSKKQKIFEVIFKGKIATLTYNFIMLLIDKGRENLIKGICRCYNILFNQSNGRIACQIISARELTDSAKSRIIKFIEQHTKLKAIPEYSLDPALLGGMKIKIDNWVYDSTIQNKLNILKRELTQQQ
jgi:F-type H+-transporting ATPase subunit delta